MPGKVFAVGQGTLKEVAQSLLEGKKMARSLENLVSSLSILADDKVTKETLDNIEELAKHTADSLTLIYKSIAREALAE